MFCYVCYANDPARTVELWARSNTRVVLAANTLKHLRARARERSERWARERTSFPTPTPLRWRSSEQSVNRLLIKRKDFFWTIRLSKWWFADAKACSPHCPSICKQIQKSFVIKRMANDPACTVELWARSKTRVVLGSISMLNKANNFKKHARTIDSYWIWLGEYSSHVIIFDKYHWIIMQMILPTYNS